MATQIFDFPFHKVSTRYPVRGVQLQLGGGWDYSTEPTTPIARSLVLSFATMKFFENPESLVNPELQISASHLEDFYIEHELHKPFIYPHPRWGNLITKFEKPLDLPEGITNGDGALKPFQIFLKESPTG